MVLLQQHACEFHLHLLCTLDLQEHLELRTIRNYYIDNLIYMQLTVNHSIETLIHHTTNQLV